jgi:hypothetical protein
MTAVAGTASGMRIRPVHGTALINPRVSSSHQCHPAGAQRLSGSRWSRAWPATRDAAWIPTLASLVREDKAVPVAAVVCLVCLVRSCPHIS